MPNDTTDTIRADVRAILAGVCKTCHADTCGECRLFQFDTAMEYRFADGLPTDEAIRLSERNVRLARKYRQSQFDEPLPTPVKVGAVCGGF
jgi:hypothetical protein